MKLMKHRLLFVAATVLLAAPASAGVLLPETAPIPTPRPTDFVQLPETAPIPTPRPDAAVAEVPGKQAYAPEGAPLRVATTGYSGLPDDFWKETARKYLPADPAEAAEMMELWRQAIGAEP